MRSPRNTYSSPTEPHSRVFGRGLFIEAKASEIFNDAPYVGLVYGVSGVGKSTVAREISRRLKENYAGEIVVVFFELEEAQAAEEPFLQLYDAIYQEIKPSALSRLRQAINKAPLKKGIKLVRGLMKDLVKRFAGDLQSTADVLSEVINESVETMSGVELRQKIKQSNFSVLLDSLRATAAASSKQYLLLLDGLERAPEACVQLIYSAVRRLPRNTKLLMFINSEHSAFDRTDISRLKNELQYTYKRFVTELVGLTSQDIQDWFHFTRGTEISTEDAEQARLRSHGRPLLLQSWIESPDLDLTKIDADSGRLYGHFDDHFYRLPDNSKDLARLLAVAHPRAVPLDTLVRASNLPNAAVATALGSLQEHRFAEQHNSHSYRCTHDLIARFLNIKMGQPISDDAKRRLLIALEAERGLIDARASLRDLAALKADLVTPSLMCEGVQYLLSFAETQLERGAYQYTMAHLDRIDQLIEDGVSIDAATSMRLKRMKADLLKELGSYNEALRFLDEAMHDTTDSCQRAQMHLSRGEAYLRLNQYPRALTELKQARKYSVSCGSPDILARSVIRTATVTWDFGKLGLAGRVGKTLERDILPRIRNGHLIRSHIYRTLARIKSLRGNPEALRNAHEALALARSAGSDRHVGNSFYALGDAYRHNNELVQAQDAYKSALKISQDIGNKDLEVYSLLGLVVLSASRAELSEFDKFLKELDAALDYEAPVEKLYLRLFSCVRDLLNKIPVETEAWEELRTQFRRLRRQWALQLLEKVSSAEAFDIQCLAKCIRVVLIIL